MQDKLLDTYISLCTKMAEDEALKEQLRELIAIKYKDGYTDEKINIHFKEIEKWTYSQDLKDLKKSHKESIEKAEKMEEISGIATKTTLNNLTITIKK